MAILSRVFNRIGDMFHNPSKNALLNTRGELEQQKKRLLYKREALKENFDAEHRKLGKRLVGLFNDGQISVQQNQEIMELCLNFLSSPAE